MRYSRLPWRQGRQTSSQRRTTTAPSPGSRCGVEACLAVAGRGGAATAAGRGCGLEVRGAAAPAAQPAAAAEAPAVLAAGTPGQGRSGQPAQICSPVLPPACPCRQVLTAVEDYGSVSSALAAAGLKIAPESSGLVYTPLVQQVGCSAATPPLSHPRGQHLCWLHALPSEPSSIASRKC